MDLMVETQISYKYLTVCETIHRSVLHYTNVIFPKKKKKLPRCSPLKSKLSTFEPVVKR